MALVITAVGQGAWFSSDAVSLIGLRVVTHVLGGPGGYGRSFTLDMDEIKAKKITFDILDFVIRGAREKGFKETTAIAYSCNGITVEEIIVRPLTLDSFLSILERPLTTEE